MELDAAPVLGAPPDDQHVVGIAHPLAKVIRGLLADDLGKCFVAGEVQLKVAVAVGRGRGGLVHKRDERRTLSGVKHPGLVFGKERGAGVGAEVVADGLCKFESLTINFGLAFTGGGQRRRFHKDVDP